MKELEEKAKTQLSRLAIVYIILFGFSIFADIIGKQSVIGFSYTILRFIIPIIIGFKIKKHRWYYIFFIYWALNLLTNTLGELFLYHIMYPTSVYIFTTSLAIILISIIFTLFHKFGKIRTSFWIAIIFSLVFLIAKVFYLNLIGYVYPLTARAEDFQITFPVPSPAKTVNDYPISGYAANDHTVFYDETYKNDQYMVHYIYRPQSVPLQNLVDIVNNDKASIESDGKTTLISRTPGIFKSMLSYDELYKSDNTYIKWRVFVVNNSVYYIGMYSKNLNFPNFEKFANSFEFLK